MNMAVDPAKLADAHAVADKLTDLPQEALLYIAGYAEGSRDAAKRKNGGCKPYKDPSDTAPDQDSE